MQVIGTHSLRIQTTEKNWIPTYVGMTNKDYGNPQSKIGNSSQCVMVCMSMFSPMLSEPASSYPKAYGFCAISHPPHMP